MKTQMKEKHTSNAVHTLDKKRAIKYIYCNN